MIEPQRGDRTTGRGHGPRRRGGDGPVLITRRALLAGGAAAALLAACSRGGDDAAGRGKRPTTTGHHHHEPPAPPAPTTGEAEATAAVDRVLEDGEHFPDGFTVPAGETWALADGAQVTTAGNVVVEGTLRLHQPDPARTMRLTFVDVDEAAFVGGGTHEVLDTDVGLWVVGAGRLDARGAPKTAWTRLTAPAAAGDRRITVEDATGWRPGDEVVVTPTAPRSDEDHHTRFDRVTVAAVEGTTVELEAPLEHDHPVVADRWHAEVINLTRSVVIEGTPDHRAHVIHLHQEMHAPADFRAASIAWVELRHLGPNQPNDRDEPTSVEGRYALHWHHGGRTTEGVVVEGVVVHDCGAHAFVPHSSNGITFRACASHATRGDAYWWDLGDSSDYVVYEGCIASDVHVDGRDRYSTNGFFAAQSDEPLSCAMRGCVATGVHGPDSAGFFWTNDSVGVWAFEDCLAHNNEVNGIRVWQNTSLTHPIDRFTAYQCHTGVAHGAYANAYQYHGVELHDCDTAIRLTAVTASDDGALLEFHDVAVTEAATDLVLADAPVDPSGPVDFRRCTFDSVVVEATHDEHAKHWDLVDCGVTPEQIDVQSVAGDTTLRVRDGDRAWQLVGQDWEPIAPF